MIFLFFSICSEPFARRGPLTRHLVEHMVQAHSLIELSSERDKRRVIHSTIHLLNGRGPESQMT